MDFLAIFRLQDTFQERIVPKSIEIDMEKLHIKFSALNVNFDGTSIDFLVQGNLHMRASKISTTVKVVILLLLAGLSW